VRPGQRPFGKLLKRKGEIEMAVFYRCELCGNLVALIKQGGGTLVCCGQSMTKLIANSTDAAQEKHVPVVKRENGKIKAVVGSALHPMETDHYIEWIALESGDRLEVIHLRPGMAPSAEFAEAQLGTVYAYCNKHGLWKADF
jgi:superoxide reductase